MNSDETVTVVVDTQELVQINGDILEVLRDSLDELRFSNEYFLYQQEQIRVHNSMLLCVLVFVGACLGALIFRHLRK